MVPRASHSLVLAAAAGLALLAGAGTASAQEIVTIPSRVIYPGETINAEALKEVVLREGKVPPAAVAMAMTDVEGKVARRTLLPGRYIALSSVRDAYLIDRGAEVQIVFISGPLTITAAAVTLEPGSVGDLVKARNIDSGKVVAGTVMADGSIRVGNL
jgi:flagella basal body P-ring formation protein FlgA